MYFCHLNCHCHFQIHLLLWHWISSQVLRFIMNAWCRNDATLWMLHAFTCQQPAHELESCNNSVNMSWIIYAGFAWWFLKGLLLYVYVCHSHLVCAVWHSWRRKAQLLMSTCLFLKHFLNWLVEVYHLTEHSLKEEAVVYM